MPSSFLCGNSIIIQIIYQISGCLRMLEWKTFMLLIFVSGLQKVMNCNLSWNDFINFLNKLLKMKVGHQLV